uniref:Uncharacterized protein n=1 Tax=Cacopsylla melanoneura TaxID=428564 RepID=A0A8D8YKH8_9HEMI
MMFIWNFFPFHCGMTFIWSLHHVLFHCIWNFFTLFGLSTTFCFIVLTTLSYHLSSIPTVANLCHYRESNLYRVFFKCLLLCHKLYYQSSSKSNSTAGLEPPTSRLRDLCDTTEYSHKFLVE